MVGDIVGADVGAKVGGEQICGNKHPLTARVKSEDSNSSTVTHTLDSERHLKFIKPFSNTILFRAVPTSGILTA